MFSHPAVDFYCGRCRKQIPHGEEEACWYCGHPLCGDCWDEYGECGHKGVATVQALSNAVQESRGIVHTVNGKIVDE